jgi:pimeloyl-ACP methyl ester carboxylesterase
MSPPAARLHRLTLIACLLGLLHAPGSARAQDAPLIPKGATIEQTAPQADGRRLTSLCMGRGSPLVLIEAGLGEPGTLSGSWTAVMTQVSAQTRVCIYDRAGIGASSLAPAGPRSAAAVLQDRAAVLQSLLGPRPAPYVAVGHSIGGLILMASTAPEAPTHVFPVAAAVLVDSAHPDQWTRWVKLLEDAAARGDRSGEGGRQALAGQWTVPDRNPERLDLQALATAARRAPGFGAAPLTLLRHADQWKVDPALSPALAAQVQASMTELQEDMLKQSSKASLRASAQGGHALQAEDPALVAAAILEHVAALRSRP